MFITKFLQASKALQPMRRMSSVAMRQERCSITPELTKYELWANQCKILGTSKTPIRDGCQAGMLKEYAIGRFDTLDKSIAVLNNTATWNNSMIV